MIKEGLLLFNDTATDAQQRIIATFQAFNQPLCILQIATNKLAVSVVARAVAHGGVVLVNLQPWNAVAVEFDHPAIVMLTHQYIRNNVFWLPGLDRLPRSGVQGLNKIDGFFQHIFFQPGYAHQRAEVMVG